ncbi:Outer membrane lipoprotein-sorting protein [Fodinibius salinus]|uniref:Outer membrane lipoprotein-sorting protein n=1 Tax=Fodinibius salinus TaxID=860790 RepID=A0A5D3YJ00_9BACT|nr:outer membrane lipoprotein carrier protein LolA [Fodinibius salinus]TYP93814.1 Outer membrane lipoprotein-sorting protein [Fodinibius salinus]
MILTNLNDSVLQFLSFLFFLCGCSLALQAQDTPLDDLKQKFETNYIFKAQFHHQSIDSYTQDTMSSRGQIWVGGTQYKVKTEHQTVVVDGKMSMVYDKNRSRVIISKYEPSEDDFAPSRILNGIDSTFTVQSQEIRDNQHYIRLGSDDPFAIYKKVEIHLAKTLIPQKIRAVDPVDNVITTTFSNGEFVSLRKNIFELDYPDNTEVVDMRSE